MQPEARIHMMGEILGIITMDQVLTRMTVVTVGITAHEKTKIKSRT